MTLKKVMKSEVALDYQEEPRQVRAHNLNSRSIAFRIDDSGDLVISVVDHGPMVEEIWGDSDYEFWYRIPAERLEVLAQRLGTTSELLFDWLSVNWRGDRFCDLEDILEGSDIAAEFSSYG
jgi:hypothetical protein